MNNPPGMCSPLRRFAPSPLRGDNAGGRGDPGHGVPESPAPRRFGGLLRGLPVSGGVREGAPNAGVGGVGGSL